jgi:hypothetical protein
VPKLLREGYSDVVDADLSKYLDPFSYCPLVTEKWWLLLDHFDS